MTEQSPPPKTASVGEIFLTFALIGATSFGGGVVAYLRNSLVSVKGWLDEEEFLTVLEISQTLPGLNATNMAVIVGDRLRGPWGAVAGLLGICIPGAILIMLLTLIYSSNTGNQEVQAFLRGVGAASVGLLAAVTLQIGHKQLERPVDLAFVVTTLLLVSFVHLSLVIVLILLSPIAVFLNRPHPKRKLTPDRSGSDHRPAD